MTNHRIETSSRYLFVYGTLKRDRSNFHCLASAKYIADGILVGYNMYSLGGYPCVAKEGHNSVYGEIYEVDGDTLRRCDILEGYRGIPGQNFYDRVNEVVLVKQGPFVTTKSYNCMVYTWSSHRVQGRELIESGEW